MNMAARHRRSPAQICLRWSIQNGVPAIPKSQNFDRLRENTQVRPNFVTCAHHLQFSKRYSMKIIVFEI